MLPVGSLGLQSDDQKTHRFRAPRHRLRGTSTQQKSSSGYPPSDSSIALLMKGDSFRPENPCQEQALLASVVLCATERAAQNLIRYRDGLRSSSYLRWISTSMMGAYVKITRHYSHNRFHPCHPTPGNMCHWRRRLTPPYPPGSFRQQTVLTTIHLPCARNTAIPHGIQRAVVYGRSEKTEQR